MSLKKHTKYKMDSIQADIDLILVYTYHYFAYAVILIYRVFEGQKSNYLGPISGKMRLSESLCKISKRHKNNKILCTAFFAHN